MIKSTQMPPFLYTIIITALATWGIWIYLLTQTLPNTPQNIIFFLTTLFLAISFTTSLPLFFATKRKAKQYDSDRKIYRKSLKIGLLIAFGVVAIMTLKAFELFTWLNLVLFLIFYALIFSQFAKKRV